MIEKNAGQLLNTIDLLALALPDGYVWSLSLRRAYERSVRLLQKNLTP